MLMTLENGCLLHFLVIVASVS